jgi:hypothetical protein|tara:strand:- start:1569 stop:1676 length:108 start_codon:yes stop_codon:yes gene_type:complete
MIIELAIFTLIPIFSFAVAAYIVDEDQREEDEKNI